MNKEAKEKPTSWDVGSQILLWGHTLERPRNILHHLLKICIFSHSLPLRPKALSCENFTGTLIHTTVSCNSLVRIQMKALFDSKIIHILNFLLIFLHSIYFDNPLFHPPAPPWSSPPPCPPNPTLKKTVKTEVKTIRPKKSQNKTRSVQKPWNPLLCGLTIPGHGACPVVWVILPVTLRWRNRFGFSQQISIANNFLGRGGILCSPLSVAVQLRSCGRRKASK